MKILDMLRTPSFIATLYVSLGFVWLLDAVLTAWGIYQPTTWEMVTDGVVFGLILMTFAKLAVETGKIEESYRTLIDEQDDLIAAQRNALDGLHARIDFLERR